MNILTSWKWLVGGVVAFVIYSGILVSLSYDKGKTKVYQDIANTPAQVTIKIVHDTIPAPYPVIRHLKADTVFQTPDEIIDYIKGLSDSVAVLKNLLAEKAKPFETSIDSTRYFLYIKTYPWERLNDVNLQLKAIPFDYSEITSNKIIVKDVPLWQHIIEVGGGFLVGYEVSRITK
jgi:hypothetical protein